MNVQAGSNYANRFNKIARGNVGDTLSDIVKEAADNSFDKKTTILRIDFDKEKKTITIADNGVGLAPDKWSKLLELDSVNENPYGINGRFGIGANKHIIGLADIISVNSGKNVIITNAHNGTYEQCTVDFNIILEKNVYEQFPLIILTEEQYNEQTYGFTSGLQFVYDTSLEKIQELEDLMMSQSFNGNLRLDFAETYKYENVNIFFNNKEIHKWEDETELDLKHTYNCVIYSNDKGKLIWAYKLDETNWVIKPKSRGYSKKLEELETLEVYNKLAEFKINCNINKDMWMAAHERSSSKFPIMDQLSKYGIKYEENKSEYFDWSGKIRVKRHNKILSTLPYNIKDQGDFVIRVRKNSFEKELEYKYEADEYIGLTLENKSNVSWKTVKPGLERFTHEIINSKYFSYVTKKMQKFIETTVDKDIYSEEDMRIINIVYNDIIKHQEKQAKTSDQKCSKYEYSYLTESQVSKMNIAINGSPVKKEPEPVKKEPEPVKKEPELVKKEPEDDYVPKETAIKELYELIETIKNGGEYVNRKFLDTLIALRVAHNN